MLERKITNHISVSNSYKQSFISTFSKFAIAASHFTLEGMCPREWIIPNKSYVCFLIYPIICSKQLEMLVRPQNYKS
jgi:hypothetical protein